MINKPNIILFITHDQGTLAGCYDSPLMPNTLNTPYINLLAAKGVRFTNYFCTAPLCSPSRGAMFTSKYPHVNGLMGLVNLGWSLPTHNKTLAMYLKENGYTTHLIGFQHESQDNSSLGYDTITQNNIVNSCKFLERDIIAFLNDRKNDKIPFYLCVGTMEVHIPFKAWGDPVNPETVKVPPFLPDHEEIRKDLSELYGAVQVVDKTIGTILNSLKSNGLLNDTLFVFTTDHGIAFPRAKSTLYDPGIKILLIMSHPTSNLFSGGKIFDPLISNIDLFPTILEYIGAQIPKDINGISFLLILKNEKKSIRNEIFAEKMYHDKYDPIRCVRTASYKFIKNCIESQTLYELPKDIYRARSGRFIRKNMPELYEKPRPDEELYDLAKDPLEKNNLIKNSAYNLVAKDLRSELDKWMRSTGDPILKK